MPLSPSQLTRCWTEVLQLSKLAPGENVLILTSQNSDPRVVDAAARAAAALQARVVKLDIAPNWDTCEVGTDPTVVSGASPIDDDPMALAAMKAADLVIDTVFLLFTPGQRAVLESGTRMLLAYEPPEVLARVMPSADDRRRVLAARDAYAQGHRITVTSAAGTRLTASIGAYPITAEYGYVDSPGRWDHWPSGFVLTWPDEGESNGRVVLDRGDILLPMKDYVTEASSPACPTTARPKAWSCWRPATSSCRSRTTCRRPSPWRSNAAPSYASRADSMPSSWMPTCAASTTPTPMRCRTWAGACSPRPAGPRSACTTRPPP